MSSIKREATFMEPSAPVYAYHRDGLEVSSRSEDTTEITVSIQNPRDITGLLDLDTWCETHGRPTTSLKKKTIACFDVEDFDYDPFFQRCLYRRLRAVCSLNRILMRKYTHMQNFDWKTFKKSQKPPKRCVYERTPVFPSSKEVNDVDNDDNDEGVAYEWKKHSWLILPCLFPAQMDQALDRLGKLVEAMLSQPSIVKGRDTFLWKINRKEPHYEVKVYVKFVLPACERCGKSHG